MDLFTEFSGDRVVAIEVKATAAPKRDAAAHLAWLRDRLGERFVCGAIRHTGAGDGCGHAARRWIEPTGTGLDGGSSVATF